MTSWTREELERIAEADELQLASLRSDGEQRKPVTMWVVRRGDDLYVRSVNGPGSSWFRGTRSRREGRIRAGGVEKDVAFVDADDDVNDELDAAYRTKYARYGAYPLNPDTDITSREARSTTIRLVPRSAAS